MTAGSVDWILGYWSPSHGQSSIDLSGNAAGTITQTFDTTPGQVYTVTFDLSGNPDAGSVVPGTRQLSVSTDGVNFTPYVFNVTAANQGGGTAPFTNMGWLPQIYTFTATGSSTTLTFQSNENSVYGAALDNVSVTAIPEPATLAVVGGLALAGLAGFRRRKTA